MESGHRDPNPVAVVSAEEEAIKRNTDCVYFLASPLTCKKVTFAIIPFPSGLLGFKGLGFD